jgi:single-stranded-DNA-specific exonuclease
VRVRLRAGDGVTVNAIAFRAVGQKLGNALTQSRSRPVHAAGCLTIDRWQGEERVQFRILDVAPADTPPRMA